MTTAKRLSDIEDVLRKLTEKKPSTFQKLWNGIMPYIIPFILGVIVGVFCSQSLLERQAASGGAAIPFLNGSLSPSPSTLPPNDSKAEPADSSSMNTSALPLPANPAADAGQTTSTRFYRLPSRMTR
jgi:hypothetical protein